MTAVIVHGAGSSGEAAAALLGASASALFLEDRSGDIDHVIHRLDDVIRQHPECSRVVGISLGAHAVARWAAHQAPHGFSDLLQLVCVLPAWVGPPVAPPATATAVSAEMIRAHGIEGSLHTLEAAGTHHDIVQLLRIGWRAYSDAELERALTAASRGRGPTPAELASIRLPVRIVGWLGDAFHPASTAREWSAHMSHSAVAMGARPEVALLQRALASIAC